MFQGQISCSHPSQCQALEFFVVVVAAAAAAHHRRDVALSALMETRMQRPSRLQHESFAERTETALEPLAIRVKKAMNGLNEKYIRPCVGSCVSCIPARRPGLRRGYSASDASNRAAFYFDFYDEDDMAFEDELAGLLDSRVGGEDAAGDAVAAAQSQRLGPPRRRYWPWYSRWFGNHIRYKPSMADLQRVGRRNRSNSGRSTETSNSFRSRGDLFEESVDEDAHLVSEDIMIALRTAEQSATQSRKTQAPTAQSAMTTLTSHVPTDGPLHDKGVGEATAAQADVQMSARMGMETTAQTGLSQNARGSVAESSVATKTSRRNMDSLTVRPVSPISSIPNNTKDAQEHDNGVT